MLRRPVVSRQLSLARAMGFIAALGLAASGLTGSALADDNGVSLTPQMAWSSWSFVRRNPTEAIIKAQAQAMHQNLQSRRKPERRRQRRSRGEACGLSVLGPQSPRRLV